MSQKVDGTEFSRINSWLRSQSENRSYLLEKKQLPATPIPGKLHSLSRNRSLEKSSAKKFTTEKITGNDLFEKLGETEESETEETEVKPTPMLNDLFELQCLCSSEAENQILSKFQNADDESLHPPSLGYDGFSQHMDNGWFGVNHTADWERDSPASIKLLEESDESLNPKSQRGLVFMEDVAPPLLRPQETLRARGKQFGLTFVFWRKSFSTNSNSFVFFFFLRFCFFFWLHFVAGGCIFMQKLQALCFRILLGLGFIDVGYGNDFFNGLTK